jgi:hypothetical protein
LAAVAQSVIPIQFADNEPKQTCKRRGVFVQQTGLLTSPVFAFLGVGVFAKASDKIPKASADLSVAFLKQSAEIAQVVRLENCNKHKLV